MVEEQGQRFGVCVCVYKGLEGGGMGSKEKQMYKGAFYQTIS